MDTKIYPKYYQLFRYKNLLINKRVAGFYIQESIVPDSSRKNGFYYQTITVNGVNYQFIYKEFTLPAFIPFSKKKLASCLDGVIKSLEDSIGRGGHYDAKTMHMLFKYPVKWAGVDSNGSRKTGDEAQKRAATPFL